MFTPVGPRRAGQLHVGDEVLVGVDDYELTDDQWQVILGGAFGDGSLRRVGTHAATFRVGHSEAQKDYLRWKRDMLAPLASAIRRTGRGFGFDTLAMPALADVMSAYYGPDRGRVAGPAALDRLDARGLAVWYADDGSFAGSYARWGKGKAVLYNTALAGDSRQRVVGMLARLGLEVRDDRRGFWFSAEQTERLHALIAPYIHPSMDYKLHPSQRGGFTWQPELDAGDPAGRRRVRVIPARILNRYVKPPTRSTHRFDLEIDGHHTYLVDGVVVHNSPETTTGGRALKFYSSIRLDIRRQDTIKNGTEAVGVRTKVKVVKNKLSPPFREAEFDVIYGEGVSKEGGVLDIAVEQNVVEKSGTWYSYNGERIGQGRENAKRYLKDNAKILLELEAKVRSALGLKPAGSAPPAAPEKASK